MKNNGMKKRTGWLIGLVGIVMIAGVILSQNAVWAADADTIQEYTISLAKGGKAVKGIKITAMEKGGSELQWESKSGEDGKVVFNKVFATDKTYTLKITSDENDYPGEVVVKDKDSKKTIFPEKQEDDGSYQFDLTIGVDQTVDITIEKKEETKLSELINLSGKDNPVFEKEDEVYIYNKTDCVEATLVDTSEVTAVGYKTGGDTIVLCQGKTFELTKTTYLTEIYIQKNNKEKNNKEWKEYKLTPEANIVFDITPPEIVMEETEFWIKGNEEEIKINFDVENGGTVNEDCSEINKIYWYKAGELNTKVDIPVPETDQPYVCTIPNPSEGEYSICAEDKAGNIGKQKITIKRDTTDPQIKKISMDSESQIAFQESATKSFKPITMAVMASDTESGIETVSLKLEGNEDLIKGEKGEDKEGETSFAFTFNSGEFVIEKIICKDKVGNEKEYGSSEELLDELVKNDIKSTKILVKETSAIISADISAGADVYREKKDSDTISVGSPENKNLKLCVKEEGEKSRMGILYIQVNKKNGDIIRFPAAPDEYDENLFDTDSLEDSKKLNVDLSTLQLSEGENKITVTAVMAGGQEIEKEFNIRYDRKAPEVTNIEVKGLKVVNGKEETETLKKGENIHAFGTFYNDKVRVVITTKDATGTNKVGILVNGKKKYEAKKISENKSTFTFTLDLPEEAIKDPKKYWDGEISVVAWDYVGNRNETETKAGHLVVENIPPKVEISCPDRNTEYYNPISNCIWYDSDTDFKVTVTDQDSGLRSTNTKLNKVSLDEEMLKSQENMTNNLDLTVHTGDVKKPEDGKYFLEVDVFDNAGNEKKEDKAIYIDDIKPEITSFEFEAEGNNESKKTDFGVKERDYGYYFSEKTKVTIRAKDAAPSSGLRSITYYTVDKDGKKSEEKTQEVSNSGSITFSIPANFKGQIYAKPTDNVGHSADRYVTPDAAVIENSAQHKEDSDIIFKKTKTAQKDAKGLDLYKKDVAVMIEVSDKYSGIREVEYSVTAPYDTEKNQKGTVGIDNAGEKKKGSASGWKRTGREKNLVTKLTGNLMVSHDSNDITVNVKLTDRAGHISKKKIKFSIDKTRPVIQISYDNNKTDKQFNDFYKEKRTASVVVTERNFNAEQIKYSVANKDGETPSVDLTQAGSWQKKENKKDPDQTTYTAQIPFYEDGKYTWDISFMDRAGNKAAEIETQKYTIDQTAPVITVTYDNVEAQNTNYYKKDRLATISITEHNFEEGRIKITGKGESDGKKVSFPAVSAWTGQGDIHTATILYSEDAEYSFNIAYTDKAGNKADTPGEDTFVIDKTAPEISIEKIENKSANKGTVKPVVRYTDVNLDPSTVNISLYGFKRKKVKNSGETREIKNGAEFTFEDFKREKEMDDIYTLTVSAQDMAGNRSENKTVSFSVNRFGSTYTFGDTLKAIISAGKQENGVEYLQELKEDVILTEINVDELQKKMTQIKLTRNGESRDLTTEDYKVEPPAGGGKKWNKREWSKYTYIIYKSNFSEDGVYKVEVRSKDNAGNKNQTVDEAKEPYIKFGIDKTAPVIIPIDLESDTQYPLESKEVKITVKDNLVTPETKIYLNESEVQYKSEDKNCILTIPSAGKRQSLRIVATDAAGNEQSVTVSDFLVSTNLFVRWYNNLPLFIGTLAILGTLAVLTVVLLVIRRKKKKEGAN